MALRQNGVLYAFCLKLIWVESRVISSPSLLPTLTTVSPDAQEGESVESSIEKIIRWTNNDKSSEDFFTYRESTYFGPDDKCAILVMSNQGQTSVQQSLLRKYRYNQDGDLIPSSVKYFAKFPQNEGTAVLVPLKDKAFSPSGGFVRYYKEIPPIPHTWRR